MPIDEKALMTQDGYGQKEADKHDPPLLFQVEQDPSERFDVAKDHPEVLADLLAEIAEMRDTVVPASEFEDSKRALIATFALSLESAPAVLNFYVQSWTYGLPADYWDSYSNRISAVTAEQARAAAKKYWDPSRLHIVAVGDAPQISAILKKKGTLEVFDADGKPIP